MKTKQDIPVEKNSKKIEDFKEKINRYDSDLQVSIDKLSQLDSFNLRDFESLSRLIEEQTCKYVACAAENKVSPKSEDGQRLVEKFGLVRRIGNRFVNMFKIEFKITFCGVVLCHLEIPKLETNKDKE